MSPATTSGYLLYFIIPTVAIGLKPPVEAFQETLRMLA
ncbi:hypothetical protein UF75_5457 [Desulfosporosinus sp. I2]|nr:hypothetical protein UF75_5457 [Desulfosporosinus sp. I2]